VGTRGCHVRSTFKKHEITCVDSKTVVTKRGTANRGAPKSAYAYTVQVFQELNSQQRIQSGKKTFLENSTWTQTGFFKSSRSCQGSGGKPASSYVGRPDRMWDLWWTKCLTGQVSLWVLRFSPVSITPQMLHTHMPYAIHLTSSKGKGKVHSRTDQEGPERE